MKRWGRALLLAALAMLALCMCAANAEAENVLWGADDDAWNWNLNTSNDAPFELLLHGQGCSTLMPMVANARIRSVTFVDALADAPADARDVSAAGDESVLAWAVDDGQLCDVFIGGEGGVWASPDSSYLFMGCSSLERIDFNGCFHMENVERARGMFCGSAMERLDLSGLDTSGVTDMSGMFYHCIYLKELVLDGIDTAGVFDMSDMFRSCESLESLDLSGFNFSGDPNVDSMFQDCESLRQLDVGDYQFSAGALGSAFENCPARSGQASRLPAWELWREDSVSIDGGEFHSAEEVDRSWTLGLNVNGHGFISDGEAMQWLDWEASDADYLLRFPDGDRWLFRDGDFLELSYEGNFIRLVGAESQQQIARIRFRRDEDAYARPDVQGTWHINGDSEFLSGVDLEFGSDAVVRQAGEMAVLTEAVLGEDSLIVGEYVALDGALYMSRSDRKSRWEIRKLEYRLSGDSFELLRTEAVPDELSVGLDLEAQEYYDPYVGAWACFGRNSGGENRAAALMLEADGSGTLRIADKLFNPGRLDAQEAIRWRPARRGIALIRGGAETELTYSPLDSALLLDVDGETLELARRVKLAALVDSAGGDFDAVAGALGVWEFSGELGDAELYAYLNLDPDGGAAYEHLHVEPSGEADHVAHADASWRFDGGEIVISLPEGELGFAPVEDGLLAKYGASFTHAANIDDWDGERYVTEEGSPDRVDYLRTGAVGVWEGFSDANPYDLVPIKLYFSIDGKGKLVNMEFAHTSVPFRWEPALAGLNMWLEADDPVANSGGIVSGESGAQLSWNLANGALECSDASILSVAEMAKTQEYWSSDDMDAAEALSVGYVDRGDGTATLTSYSGAKGQIELPAQVDGLTVAALGENLLAENAEITGVTIPDCVTEIGMSAFNNCVNLRSVALPEGLKRIGSTAFAGCAALTDVRLPEGLEEIEFEAFRGAGLTWLVLPESLTRLGRGAFSGCNFTELTLPAGLAASSTNAFADCANLSRVVIEDGATAIAEGLFSGCYNLQEAVVPESVTSIGYGAFQGCKIPEFVFPVGLVSIDNNAFTGTQIQALPLLEDLEEIGSLAFQRCYKLATAEIGAKVREIGSNAFADCENLNLVRVLSADAEFGSDVFLNSGSVALELLPGSTAETYASGQGMAFTYLEGVEAPAPAQPAAAPLRDCTEDELRGMISDYGAHGDIEMFYADYDGDGAHEAFAFIGYYDSFTYNGSVWFANANGVTPLQSGLGYAYFEIVGEAPSTAFLAEENYGGSGSTTYMWSVSAGEPVRIEAPAPEEDDYSYYGEEDYDYYGEEDYDYYEEEDYDYYEEEDYDYYEEEDYDYYAEDDYYDDSESEEGEWRFFEDPEPSDEEFLENVIAYDIVDDPAPGEGQTSKPYYFYMDGGVKREYGGIEITLEELCEYADAQQYVQEKLDEGCELTEILYRANGAVNVNFRSGAMHEYVTLRLSGNRALYWTGGVGFYLSASDPGIATYPEAFSPPPQA